MDPMDAFALAVVKFDMNDILRWLFVRLPKKGDSFLGLTADESDVPAGRLKGLDAYLCRMPAADLRLIGDMHGNGRGMRRGGEARIRSREDRLVCGIRPASNQPI